MEKEQETIINQKVIDRVKPTMLSNEEFDDMSMLFKMFADQSRLKVLKALMESEMCVTDLAYLLDMTQSAVSHQLASLKKMRLVRSTKVGKVVYYALADDHIFQIFSIALTHVQE